MGLLGKTVINMKRRVLEIQRALVGIVLIGIVFSTAACSGQDAQTPVTAT